MADSVTKEHGKRHKGGKEAKDHGRRHKGPTKAKSRGAAKLESLAAHAQSQTPGAEPARWPLNKNKN